MPEYFQLARMNHEEQALLRAFPQYRGHRAAAARLVPGRY